ncbi:MarR family winged helix-turn-helix transcriptional regulator [Vallicoccus soli]|uniref:MarR family winged helix-turn-helix transcriptional regulator n=1 Tax=Vallicoccus soli TaxID=2339232 RepID=UPI001402793F|nr:MarR family winged helix-turn-helix transcriptional regulator [Vallicoccus soli]
MRRGVVEVDDALLRLRRLWSASRSRLVDDGGTAVEMSSLLVVEACARGAQRGAEVAVVDVAELADVAPSTASRLVDRAAAAGLLERRPSAVDPRRTALVLTERGWGLRERAVRARTGWLQDTLAAWSDEDVARLGALLARFADEVGRPPLS